MEHSPLSYGNGNGATFSLTLGTVAKRETQSQVNVMNGDRWVDKFWLIEDSSSFPKLEDMRANLLLSLIRDTSSSRLTVEAKDERESGIRYTFAKRETHTRSQRTTHSE